MRLKDLSFKVGDEVFNADEISEVHCDAIRCHFVLLWSNETSISRRIVTCDPRDVEVIVDGA